LGKAVGKSLFAQKRELSKLNSKASLSNANTKLEEAPLQLPAKNVVDDSNAKILTSKNILLDEIHENMLGDVRRTKVNPNLMDNVLGEIVERTEAELRPAIEYQEINQVSCNI